MTAQCKDLRTRAREVCHKMLVFFTGEAIGDSRGAT